MQVGHNASMTGGYWPFTDMSYGNQDLRERWLLTGCPVRGCELTWFWHPTKGWWRIYEHGGEGTEAVLEVPRCSMKDFRNNIWRREAMLRIIEWVGEVHAHEDSMRDPQLMNCPGTAKSDEKAGRSPAYERHPWGRRRVA